MASIDSLISPPDRNRMKQEEAIEAILRHTTDENAQLDGIAKARNYFQAPERLNNLLNAYMSGQLAIDEAVSTLADPIDAAYTSGDHGRAYWRHEQTARSQRQHHSPEKAAELWGVEQDFAELEYDEDQSTEMQLWNTWYAVIHAARKVSWRDDIQQTRLVDLVKMLKDRPDPPLPADITPAMRRDWIYQSGVLWSQLGLMGPSFREAWNDSPGCGAGYHPLELRAWRNLNAFAARLCAEKVVSYWSFCTWAMHEMCEAEKHSKKAHKTPLPLRLSAWTPAAAAWIHMAGRDIFLAIADREDGFAELASETAERSEQDRELFTRKAWLCWKKQFNLLSREVSRADEDTRLVAHETALRMNQIESEVEGVAS